MDGNRFDALSRSSTIIGSRRSLTRSVAAGLGAGLLARLGPAPVATAACKKLGKTCDKNADRCCGGAECKRRTCKCPAGRRQCGQKCIRVNQCCGNTDCNGGICNDRNACVAAPNQGICTAGQNACVNSDGTGCGANCRCYVTRAGLSFCGRNAVDCGCGANNDCAHIPGAVCVQQTTGCCAFAGNTTCALPCQDPD